MKLARGLLAAALAALVGFAARWVWTGHVVADGDPLPDEVLAIAAPDDAGSAASALPAFGPFEVSPEIRSAWDVERAAPAPDGDEARALIDAWQQLNFAEGLSARALFQGDVESVRAALVTRRTEWIAANGAEAYLRLGWTASRRFATGLDGLLTAARGGTPVRALLEQPLRPEVHAYYEGCGGFMEQALASGLVTDAGELRSTPDALALLFRVKWLADAGAALVADPLPPAERAEYQRWRIETLRSAPVDRRLRWLDEYLESHDAVGALSPAAARAAIYAEAGDLDAARAALARAGTPDAGTPPR
ncbi:MAG: hypothetical protein H6697_03065 [Myxococcales bacterium]|nr:hypothetical protein [Myxococcales bacterium]MCB9520686.1 hypothetical protein [Myxococcales bacterium]